MFDKKNDKKQGQIRVKSQAKILAAATDEFILQGYKGATVQSIADRAALPKANVLYYFKNKENIYHAVLEQTLDMWDQGIGDILYEDGPRLAIEKFIAAKVKMSFTNPNASKIYAMEIMQGEQDEPFKFTIVPTMFDKRTKASILAYKKLQEVYTNKVWPGVVPIDTNFRNASVAQQVPSDYAANSRGTFAYKSLLDYLMSQVKNEHEVCS